jgi:hypothetical protein
MLSNISDLFTMASLAICMLLSGIIFYYLRTRINMLEQSVVEQAQLLQQVVTSIRHSQMQQSTTTMQPTQSTQQIKQTVTGGNAQQLIQVSDDSDNSDDSDDSDDSDSDDSESDSDSDSDDIATHSKLIDLSALTSTITSSSSTSSSNYFEHSNNNNADIKVIELRHNFNDGEYCLQNNDSDSDSDGDESDDSDDGESDGESDSDGDDERVDNNKDSKANCFDNHIDNHIDKHFDSDKNRKPDSTSLKRKLKGKEEEEHHPAQVDISLKNMPVNMLRDLAKTKLTHLEQPTINKMSKKEILKALDI